MNDVDVFLSPESQARFDALLASFALGGTRDRAIRDSGARALNHAANSGRKLLVGAIAQDFGIQGTDVRPYVLTRRATADLLSAHLYAFDRKKTQGIPLINLDATGPEPSRGKGAGVTSRGGARPHGFLATMPRSGHRGVFQRRGSKRTPIQEQFTPSVRQAFGRHRSAAVARALVVLHTDLQTELQAALQGGVS